MGLLFGDILGSCQPLILRVASIFSRLPPAPPSSHYRLSSRHIILYILRLPTLHHKKNTYSSLLISLAHVPVSSSRRFLTHCTNAVPHSWLPRPLPCAPAWKDKSQHCLGHLRAHKGAGSGARLLLRIFRSTVTVVYWGPAQCTSTGIP